MADCSERRSTVATHMEGISLSSTKSILGQDVQGCTISVIGDQYSTVTHFSELETKNAADLFLIFKDTVHCTKYIKPLDKELHLTSKVLMHLQAYQIFPQSSVKQVNLKVFWKKRPNHFQLENIGGCGGG